MLCTQRLCFFACLLTGLCLIGVGTATATDTATDLELELELELEDRPEPERLNDFGSLTLYVENDLFAGTDRYYTSGVKLSYLSQDKGREELGPVFGFFAEHLPRMEQRDHLYNIGWAFGQNIYTPENTEVEQLIVDDRPYAGWLYLSGSLHHKSERDVHIFELTLGVVGPESLGEDAQNKIHHHRDIQEAEGWDNQLGTEPGMILSYDYRWRVMRQSLAGDWLQADLLHSMGLSLGNVLTEANSGLTGRLGYNLPFDFQGIRIRQTGYAEPPEEENLWRRVSLYVYSGVMGHAVAYDVFLDGNTFTDSHSVDKHIGYAEGVLGVGLMYGRFRLSYTHIFVSEQFEQQDGGQQVGSLAMTVAF